MYITARITFIHAFIHSSNIWLSYILNRLCQLSEKMEIESGCFLRQEKKHMLYNLNISFKEGIL